jgi:hypothetical protein
MSLIHALLICLAATTVALIGLLIYRSIVSMKEEDQLFLDPAECHFERQQQAIVDRLNGLTSVVWSLAIASIGLLALLAAVWIYQNVQVYSARLLG